MERAVLEKAWLKLSGRSGYDVVFTYQSSRASAEALEQAMREKDS